MDTYENQFYSKETSLLIKGMMAIVVMMGHIDNVTPLILNRLIFGFPAVGVFFYYSGYLLEHNYCDKDNFWGNFLLKKVLSLYLPFVIGELMWLFYLLLAGNDFGIFDIIKVIFGLKLLNTTLWYLVELMILDALFYLIKNNNLNMCIWWIMFMLFIVLGVYFDIGIWWYMSTSCFALGLNYKKVNNIVKMATNSKIMKLLIYINFLFLYFLQLILIVSKINIILPNTYLLVGIYILIAPSFVLFLVTLLQNKQYQVPKIGMKIGEISLFIYIYHALINNIVKLFLSNDIVILILTIIITILFSNMMSKIHKKLTIYLISKF